MNRTETGILAEKAKNGDRAAFEELYIEYSDRVYLFAVRYSGSPSAAEDITSETFADALEGISELRSGGSFIAWLYSIAYRKCAAYHRENERSEYIGDSSQLDSTLYTSELNEPVMLPDDYAENEQLREQLRETIDGLPKDLRSAVILYYYEDLNISEVASSLGISEGNACQKLFRARRKIRKRIEKLVGGGLLIAVPFEAVLEGSGVSGTAAYVSAGTAGIAAKSLPLRLIGFGAAAAVAVSVPIALSRLPDSKGDRRPDETVTLLRENPAVSFGNRHLTITVYDVVNDDYMVAGKIRMESLDAKGDLYLCSRAINTPRLEFSASDGIDHTVSILDGEITTENGHTVVRSDFMIDALNLLFSGKLKISLSDSSNDLNSTYALSTEMTVKKTANTYCYISDSGKKAFISKYGMYEIYGKRYKFYVRVNGSKIPEVFNDRRWYERDYHPERITELFFREETYRRV